MGGQTSGMNRSTGSAARSAFKAFARAALGLSFGLIVLIGCTPESRNPLPDGDRVAPDARLIGHWHASIEGADYVADITRNDALSLHIALTETLPIGKQPVTKTGYLADVYAIGSRTVMAFHEIEPEPANWRFAVALLTGDDRASLMFMNGKFVRGEVFRAAFNGIIRTDDPTFPDVLITAKPEDIATLIRNTDETKLFNVPFGPFERQP
jgi:hypothetical protein